MSLKVLSRFSQGFLKISQEFSQGCLKVQDCCATLRATFIVFHTAPDPCWLEAKKTIELQCYTILKQSAHLKSSSRAWFFDRTCSSHCPSRVTWRLLRPDLASLFGLDFAVGAASMSMEERPRFRLDEVAEARASSWKCTWTTSSPGPQRPLEELEKELRKRIRMKSQIHPLIEGEKFTHLKRTREIFSNGIFISPRSKYITDLLKMLKLLNCNPAPTPYVHSDVKEGGKLSESNTKLFRAGVGIALYLSYDRTDIEFAIWELTKDMKDPNDGSMTKLHRLARYLQGTKDYGIWLERRGGIATLVVHSDTDWANCKKTRKSCACAMFSVGGCLLYRYARSLQMLCLSSGEAEFNGGVAACAEGLFLKEIFTFAGRWTSHQDGGLPRFQRSSRSISTARCGANPPFGGEEPLGSGGIAAKAVHTACSAKQ